jgi:hypothetical protein
MLVLPWGGKGHQGGVQIHGQNDLDGNQMIPHGAACLAQAFAFQAKYAVGTGVGGDF